MRATASNKDAVNSELKKVSGCDKVNGMELIVSRSCLKRTHKEQSIRQTGPRSNFKREQSTSIWYIHISNPDITSYSLKSQAQRTTYTPQPAYAVSSPTLSASSSASKQTKDTALKKKKKKNDGTSTSSFPSPYLFSGSAEEEEAKARRAARFQKPAATSSSNHAAASGGIGMWFVDDAGGSGGLGMVPGQVGKRKIMGKGNLGYGGAVVQEVDPVSHSVYAVQMIS